MPIAAPRTTVERVDSLTTDMYADLNGNLTAEPSNLYLNWWFGDKDEFGDPVDWVVGVPPAHDGHSIFLTEPGKGRASITCQTTEPIPLDRWSYQTNQTWVPGHSPQSRQMGERSGLAPPALALVVTKKPISKAGYKAGVYPLSYWYEDKHGRRSPMAPAVFVTIPQGGRILVTLPTDVEDGVTKLGLCLGRPGGALATCRVQKTFKVKHMPATYELNGPYRSKKSGPSENETKRGKAGTPKVTKRDSKRTLPKGHIEIQVSEVDEKGDESLPSDPVIFDFTEDQPNTELAVEPTELALGSEGFKVYANIDGVQLKSFSASTGFVDTFEARSSNQIVIINGEIVQGGTSGGSSPGGSTGTNTGTGSASSSSSGSNQTVNISDVRNTGKTINTTRKGPGGGGGTGLATSDRKLGETTTSTTDKTGVPEPSSALEAPAVLASLSPLPPGDYICAYARTRGEYESRISPTASFTLTGSGGVATEVAKLTIPHPFNQITNAQFTDLDADDLPDDHIAVKGSGNIYAENGILTLDTVGSRTTTDTPYHSSGFFTVDRSTNYECHAELDAAITNGTFEVLLMQYNIASPVDGSTPTTTTLLKSQSVSGGTEYTARFGPWGTALASDTLTCRVYHRITGATRNMIVNMSEWYFRGFEGGVRKYGSIGGVYDPDPPAETSYPATSFKIVEKPRRRKKKARTTTIPLYLDLQQFNGFGGTPDPLSSAWTKFSFGSVTNDPQATAKINGDYGYRFQKTVTTTGYSAAYKNYAGTRASLAKRALFRLDAMPTCDLHVLAIRDTTAAPTSSSGAANVLGEIMLRDDGAIECVQRSPSGNKNKSQVVYLGYSTGDVLDLEIIVRKAGTSSAELVFLAARNGVRKKVVTFTGIGFSGRYAQQVVVGVYAMETVSRTFNLASDDWIVSDAGAPLTLTTPVPPLEPLPTEDRPINSTAVVANADFNTGAITYGSFIQSPTLNTVAQVQAAAAIEGAYGVRCSDSGTALSTVVFDATFSPTRQSVGVRWLHGTVTRPSSGEVTIGRILSSTSVKMFDIIMDSSGNVYSEAYTFSGTLTGGRRQILAAVTNGESITLEMVLVGAGTSTGSALVYATRAGKRYLMDDRDLIDWTGVMIAEYRLGGVVKTIATTTYSFNVDQIRVTDYGEYVWEQTTAAGDDIEQVYLVMAPDQPVLPGMFLNGGARAVVPGAVYQVGIKCRWRGIPTGLAAWPFYIVGHDTDGNTQDIASLVEDRGGLQGSSDAQSDADQNGWVHFLMQIVIPEDVFVIEWQSRNMIEGEYVCQSPQVSKGILAKLEVTYPLTCSVQTTIETQTPKMNEWLAPIARTWRRIGTPFIEAPGCTLTSTYQSGNLVTGTQTPATPTADTTQVPQARYLTIFTNITTDGVHSPTIPSGSPLCEYELEVNDTLLMDNESELPGGVVVGGVQEWINKEKVHIIDLETGKVIRQGTGIAIGFMPGILIQCFALVTKRYLEEWWAKRDWIIQTPLEKITIRPKGELQMIRSDDGSWITDEDGFAFAWFESDTTDDFEVLEVVPHPWLEQPVGAGV